MGGGRDSLQQKFWLNGKCRPNFCLLSMEPDVRPALSIFTCLDTMMGIQ
jgi:hypothetical protein